MTVFFSSDPHFGHTKLMQYYPQTRGRYQTVDQVDAAMIRNWNNVVEPDDIVFLLGDLGAPVKHLDTCLWQLKGQKILIRGNHDKKSWKDPAIKKHFVETFDSYHEEWIGDVFVVMCHYPIWEWNGMHLGAYHVHGHLHGFPHNVPGRILDVGMDNHNLKPISFLQVSRFMQQREIRTHDKRSK